MVEGQEIKPKGPGVVHLVLSVITFDAQRAGPLSEIHFESFAERNDESAVSLKEVPINLGTRLVRGIALKSLRSLSPLQVQPSAPTFSFLGIGCIFQNQG